MELDRSDGDVDIGLGDGPESEDGEGSNNKDQIIERNGRKLGGNEKASPHRRSTESQKGNAAIHKMPSPPTLSATLRLGKDIPVTYKPLGDPLGEDELVELDWFALAHGNALPAKPSKKGKMKLMAPISSVSPPTSPTLPSHHWHPFVALQMTLNPELEALGEVKLSDGTFRFPFNAQVIKYFNLLDSFLICPIIARAGCNLSTS
jgi:hypothetical protein